MSVSSQSDARATPAKCAVCSRPMEIPVVCAGCQTLYGPAAGRNYFELFGLGPTYDIDAADLRRRFLNVSREVHPDRFSGKPEEVAALSLEISAQINRAYGVLCDPLLRAAYLLELAGGKSAAADKAVPQAVLMQALAMREGIEEAKAEGDSEALSGFQGEAQGCFDSLMAEVASLARRLGEAGGGSVEDTKRELREKLNSIKYFRNLLDQL